MLARSSLLTVFAFSLTTLACGLLLGFWIWGGRPGGDRVQPAHDDHADHDHDHDHDDHDHDDHDHDHETDDHDHDDHDDHGDHIDLSVAGARNLGLRFERMEEQTFRKHLHVPALVIEKPGQSGLAVTSPAQGVIRQIYRFPGQAISEGDLLFTLQVADEALESAQLSILETLTRITVAELEIERMEPLAQSGAIVGRRKLELEYELKQLQSERAARLQELKLRGLNDQQIERITRDRELVGEIEIRLEIVEPASITESDTTESESAGSLQSEGVVLPTDSSEQDAIYTVEQLDVYPGRAVRKGEDLCHIANHHELFLRGEAFETDVQSISEVGVRGWGITAEFGEENGRMRIDDLQVTYIDNHVDPKTQTFPFYLPLPNQVVAENRDSSGRLFRSWKYKPGQRAHLLVPVDEWPGQIVLPRDAVVRSGPEAFVFRLEMDSDSGFDANQVPDVAASSEGSVFELEPVSVHVLHQDRRLCVISRDGDLKVGDIVAMNRAYQIFLAWKMQISGGGGIQHDHDH